MYRHKWRAGDVLMWDNRCLLHRADANFDAARYPRVLHRTCLRGTCAGVRRPRPPPGTLRAPTYPTAWAR